MAALNSLRLNSLGIFAAPTKAGSLPLALQLVSLAEAHGITPRLQPAVAAAAGGPDLAVGDEQDVAAADVLVTLSGDGGVLTAARAAAPFGTPVLAVDLGRLGFLSAVRPPDLEQAFGMLLHGRFEVEERMMLEAQVLRPAEPGAVATSPSEGSYQLVGGNIGLNDAVVAKSNLARIMRLAIFVAGELVAQVRADGLVIATPTGSSAYALAAGGPIVHPEVPLLLLCPICAHSLTQRPLVVNPSETVEVRASWEGDEVASAELEAMVTIDGQIGFNLFPADIVRVRRSKSIARLLRAPGDSFYSRLRQKMSWGG